MHHSGNTRKSSVTGRLFLTILFAIPGFSAYAQDLPVSNIWLFDIREDGQSWVLDHPQFLTAFNKEAYNNQPFFASDDRLWITVQDGEQTDIHELNIATKTKTPLTQTAQTSEYSAAGIPGSGALCVVRVEADGVQRLWSFPGDGREPMPLFPDIEKVGYYTWLRDSLAALFIVGEDESAHTLVVATQQTQRTVRVSGKVGRCLSTTEDRKLVFVHKASEMIWYLKSYELETHRFNIIAVMPKGVEDFVVLPGDRFLCAEGSKLMVLGADERWRSVADLSDFGITNISRMAFNKKNQLAVVSP